MFQSFTTPDEPSTTSQPSPNAISTDDLLARLLATYKKPAKGQRAPSKKLPRNAIQIPFEQSFAKKKTGYKVWKAVARVIQIEPQLCSLCGQVHRAVKGEFFALENGTAHATWLRTEAYGIEFPETLPIQTAELPLREVTACAFCAELEMDLTPSPQMSFNF